MLARLETHGIHFELLVDPEIALAFREKHGEMPLDLDDLLAAEGVWIDARSGERASDEELTKGFATTDILEVVKRILLKGDLQLTTDQRRRMVERKRRLIVAHIARNAINPQTKAPHPPQRIENAMEEARIHIDPFKSMDAQLAEVVKALRPLIPLKFEMVTVAVRLPPAEAGKAYSLIRGFGELKREEWQKDGSWVGLIEIPGGMQTDFYGELNKRTHGAAETRIVKQ